MKKRLKNLLALCMVAMMMLAMSTGVVSAETYYVDMPPGGVNQYKADKNHGNDTRTLYKGITDTGTMAMNPGDIIVPLELTGAGDSAADGKYDDFCGIPFFIVKSVNKDNLGDEYQKKLNNALSENYINEKLSALEKVYRADSSWDSYKIACRLDTSATVEITPMTGGGSKSVAIQEWKESSGDAAAMLKFKFYDQAAIDEEEMLIQNISLSKLSENNTEVNGFIRSNTGNATICSALKLPDCSNGSGYHYNVKKISATMWDNEYGPKFETDPYKSLNSDNIPTGIKPLTAGSGADYGVLVDTVFAYKQDASDANCSYQSQVNTGLEITEAPNTYTVNFDANGGEGTMEPISNKTFDGNAKLPANGFTKKGYVFAGWKIKEASYTDPIDASLDPVAVDTTKAPYKDLYEDEAEYIPGNHNETVTLEAQWTANDYTVKFDTDGGTAVADKTVKWDGNILTDVEEPAKDGYVFTGWKYGDTDVTADTTYAELAGDATVKELTLKAQYEQELVPGSDPSDTEEPSDPEEPSDTDKTSKTGDDMNIALLMTLMILSGCGIAGAGLYRRKSVK